MHGREKTEKSAKAVGRGKEGADRNGKLGNREEIDRCGLVKWLLMGPEG